MADDDGPEVLDLGVVDEPDAPGSAPSPGRRPLPRRALIVLGGLAAAAAGFAVVHGQTSAPSAGRATPPNRPAPSASGGPTASLAASGPAVVVTELGRRLLDGPAVDVFALAPQAVVRVEPATGRVTHTRATTDGAQSFVPVRGGVLVQRSTGSSYLVPDGGTPRDMDALSTVGGPLLPGPDLDHVWITEPGDGALRMALVGIDGRRTGTTMALPTSGAWQIVPDGAGFTLVTSIGGTYWAGPRGLVRLTTGPVLAAGPTGWLVLDCDDRARCSALLVGRDGGRHTVAGGLVRPADAAGTFAAPSGVLAPDGRTAAMFVTAQDGTLRLTTIDLARARRVETDLTLVPDTPSVALAWTPDGRRLLAVDSLGRPVVVDPVTGAVRPLVPGTVVPALPVVQQLVVRRR